jgi:cbb3-type cytochrome c oxidase subunit III
MKKMLVIAAAIAALGAYGSAQAAGDAAAGKVKSATCAACHGADGNSAAPNFPKLAGQHAGYIIKQLHDFKSGARKDPTMTAMAAPLSDQDIENLAAYFSSQKVQGGTTDPKLLAEGEKLYRGGDMTTGVAACAGCHGPTGAGNPAAHFPSLSHQHAQYVEKQLKDFRAGTRTNDAGKMMENVAAHLTDQQIEAVASYVQGLH